MRKTLFRPEVTASKGNAWYGQAVLLQPLSFRLLTGCVILFVIGVLLLANFGQYTRRIPASGVLIPDLGLIKIQSPQSGIVLERRVREGQRVTAGEVLYVVSAEVTYASGVSSASGIGSEKNVGKTSTMLARLHDRQKIIQQDRSKTSALAARESAEGHEKVHSLRAEIAQLDQELVIQKERLKLKNEQYERNVTAQETGFISHLALQQKYDELLDQKSRIQAMQRSRLGLMRDLAAAQASLDAIAGKSALANSQLERQILDVEQERITQESSNKILITAPQAGVVAVVLAEAGQRVDSQTLLTILPENSLLEAQVFVPGTMIGFIRETDPVVLRFAAFPHQKFGGMNGTVSQISKATLTTTEQASEVIGMGAGSDSGYGAGSAGRYRVRIKLPAQHLLAQGRQHRLRAGMQVEVRFTQERRALIEWILEPLYTLRDKT